MRYGSVCSGIEAATVAWHSIGWRPVFFAEVAAFPSAVPVMAWIGKRIALVSEITAQRGCHQGAGVT